MRAHHGADRRAAVGLHDDPLAGARQWRFAAATPRCGRNVCARPTGVSFTATSGSADGGAHSCSTSQSATTLTPALRSSATSARSIAANARDAALAAIRRRQPLERRPDVGVRERA